MTENGNKDGSWLLAAVLVIALMLSLASICLIKAGKEEIIPAFRDPVLSPILVRGSIMDREGRYLAIQAPDYGFNIHLNDAGSQEAAAFISAYTDENAISIGNKIENGETFIRITKLLDTEDFNSIRNGLRDFSLSDDISPVSIEKRRRFYPAATMVGYVGNDMHGRTGIELVCDRYLSAKPEIGSAISHGNDVVLTIDADLQQQLYDVMLVTARNGRAAILSPEGYVLAFYGSADNAELLSMIKSVSGSDYQKQEFPHEATGAVRGFKMYIDTPTAASTVRAAINKLIISQLTAEP